MPRPLFVEEFGLKRLMETSGTALPMSRADFEAGRWSSLIVKAHELGRMKKEKHRKDFIARKGEDKIDRSIDNDVVRFLACLSQSCFISNNAL